MTKPSTPGRVRRMGSGDRLAKTEARFRVAVETMLDPFAILSAVRDESGQVIDFTYDYINPAGYKALGGTRAQIVGRRLLELLPHLKDGELLAAYRRVVETGEPLSLSIEAKTYADVAGGQPRQWILDIRAVRLEDGLVVTWRDITATKPAETEHAELVHVQEARDEANAEQTQFAFLAEAGAVLSSSLDYETTLASVARLAIPYIGDWCTIDMIGEDGTIELLAVAHIDEEKVQWARELRTRYPIDPDSPVGMPSVVRTGRSELYADISDAMLESVAKNDEELRLLHAVGYRSAMIVPLNVRGRIIGAITFVSTDARRHYGPADLNLAENLARHAALAIDNARLYREVQALNESLERRAATLEAANHELEAFAYSISHDLRSPLRSLDGFSRILLEEYGSRLEPRARRYLGFVRENAQHMGQLIDDLLTFSRLSRQPLRKQLVDPSSLVRRAMEELSPMREGRQVEIVVGELPPCEGDQAMLRMVFVNLLSNALKFTRRCQGARIEVGCRQQDGENIYFVADNGVGFDMRYADKLFGVFQRFHRAEDYEGTGAGLAIVQRIIHRHGGRIWAEAEVGRGRGVFLYVGLTKLATGHILGREKPGEGVRALRVTWCRKNSKEDVLMPSKVYFGSPKQSRLDARETLPVKLDVILDKLAIRDRVKGETVAIKMHLGGNVGYSTVHPVFVRRVVQAVKDGGGKPFVVDLNWAEESAKERGYTAETVGCPIYPAGGVGEQYYYAHTHPYKNLTEWRVGGAIQDASFLIGLAHIKGHPSCGFGGAFKNLALGCMMSPTRSAMHDSCHYDPYWFSEKCPDEATRQAIIASCPHGAIVQDKSNPDGLHLHIENCNQCGRCLQVAPRGSWKIDAANFYAFQQALAISVSISMSTFAPGKTSFISLATQQTPVCDCFGFTGLPVLPDAGIFGSDDIVAIDQAALDVIAQSRLIEENLPSSMEVHCREGHPYRQLHGPLKDPYLVVEYGAQLGLGSREYELIDIMPVEKITRAPLGYISTSVN